MKDFAGKVAVVTGGGSGMGRELVRQLVSERCNVAMCDLSMQSIAETKRWCESGPLLQGSRITTHCVDVSDEAQVIRFRYEVAAQQETDRIHLLFNNAGIAGGGSIFDDQKNVGEDIQHLLGRCVLQHARFSANAKSPSGDFMKDYRVF